MPKLLNGHIRCLNIRRPTECKPVFVTQTPTRSFRFLDARLALLCLLQCCVANPAFGQSGGSALSIHPGARNAYTAILMWHDVVPGKKDVWFDVTTREIAAQFAEIKRRGFNVVSLGDLFKHLTTGSPLPSRPLVITFDDTTEGIYRYAFPLLKSYRYPATLFIHTDYVGVRTEKEHCTWPQLMEMQNSGLVSVQSHTRTHPSDLRKLSDKKLQDELAGSKHIIERKLGYTVFAFAYTEGGHDARVRRAVVDAGYKIAIDESWGSAESSPDLAQVHRYTTHRRWKQALDDVDRAYRRSGQRSVKKTEKNAPRGLTRP